MNEPILPPLPPETVDELLSAALDGELDAAAADLGVDLETARAAVSAHGERQEQLARARDAVADVQPLDEVTRRRLVSGAMAAAAPAVGAPRRRPAFAVGGVAAAALVALLLGIGGLVVGIASWTSSDPSDDTATGDTSTAAVESTPMLDLGDVSDAGDLRRAVSDQLAGGDAGFRLNQFDNEESSVATDDAGAQLLEKEDGAERHGVPSASSGPVDETHTRAAGPDEAPPPVAGAGGTGCSDRVAADLKMTDPPLLLATAEHGARPAGVSVFEVDGRVIVVVYALDDCTLLTSQSWAAG